MQQPATEVPKPEPQPLKAAKPRGRGLAKAAMAPEMPKPRQSQHTVCRPRCFSTSIATKSRSGTSSLKNYINLKPLAYPMTFRRGSQKSFSKANLNIVERLANSLMRGGQEER